MSTSSCSLNISCLMATSATLALAPLLCLAQTTELQYQGDVIEGTLDYLPANYPISSPSLPTATFIGTFTGSMKLTGSVKAKNLKLDSYKFQFTGDSYTGLSLEKFTLNLSLSFGAPVERISPTKFCADLGCVTVITGSNGSIIGASVVVNKLPDSGVSIPTTLGTLDDSGDSISYTYADPSLGSCINLLMTGSGPLYPCDVNGSTHTSGKWIAAY